MRSRRLFGVLAAAVLGACAHPSVVPTTVPAAEARSQGSLDANLVSDFERRAVRYMRLHNRIQKQGARQTHEGDIGENLVAQQAMAMRIRAARYEARRGDLFTPAIALALRRALDPEIRGPAARRVRELIREDAPATFALVVNGSFPEGEPRSTMPGNLLRILPQLPTGLEYRIIGRHLVLIDLDANIVVDYMLDIM
jgi:hypothetical protein